MKITELESVFLAGLQESITDYWGDFRTCGNTGLWWDNHFHRKAQYFLPPPLVGCFPGWPRETSGRYISPGLCLSFRIFGQKDRGTAYEIVMNLDQKEIVSMRLKELLKWA